MLDAVPNNARATTSGPIVVPRLLIPPPRLILLLPVDSSPEIINGLADVCCNEKPKATINKPNNIPNVLNLTEIIIAIAPNAENKSP